MGADATGLVGCRVEDCRAWGVGSGSIGVRLLLLPPPAADRPTAAASLLDAAIATAGRCSRAGRWQGRSRIRKLPERHKLLLTSWQCWPTTPAAPFTAPGTCRRRTRWGRYRCVAAAAVVVQRRRLCAAGGAALQSGVVLDAVHSYHLLLCGILPVSGLASVPVPLPSSHVCRPC